MKRASLREWDKSLHTTLCSCRTTIFDSDKLLSVRRTGWRDQVPLKQQSKIYAGEDTLAANKRVFGRLPDRTCWKTRVRFE